MTYKICSIIFNAIHVNETGRYLLGLCLSSFLNIGATLASFQSSGTCPVVRGIWKIICSMGVISLLSSFKAMGSIESGSEALWSGLLI